jgi:hypothetical protein
MTFTLPVAHATLVCQPLQQAAQLSVGTPLLLHGIFPTGPQVQLRSVVELVVNPEGDLEVVIDKKLNHYFNLRIYQQGDSWVQRAFLLPASLVAV